MLRKKNGIVGILLLLCVCLSACGTPASTPEQEGHQATLSVTCEDAMGSELLSDALREALPEGGVLYAAQTVSASEGETVLELLSREMRLENIPLDVGDGYVKGIGSLYEGACGEVSGWLFRVNGEMPSVGAGDCVVQEGDLIEWFYICDMNELFAESAAPASAPAA
ncbi:MAG: DUF4430 domain-containing protein [Oscillospiraceae bacterium]|jgi:hypothetical protein